MRRVLPGLPKLKVKRMFRDLKWSSGELSHHLIWLRARRESKRGERDGEREEEGGRWRARTLSELTDTLGSPPTCQRVAVCLISPAAGAGCCTMAQHTSD